MVVAWLRRVRPRTGALTAAAALGAAIGLDRATSRPHAKPAPPAPPTVLVMSGDCGGTHTRLMIHRIVAGLEPKEGHRVAGEEVLNRHYLNASHDSFESVCRSFLAEAEPLTGGQRPAACCLAVAGAVDRTAAGGKVKFTNRETKGWSIDAAVLTRQLRIPRVRLINDFEAQVCYCRDCRC